MKKLFFLPAATFVLAATVNAQGSEAAVNTQTSESTVKNEIASINRQEYLIKKEKHEDKKELRKLRDNEVGYYTKQQFFSDFGNLPVIQWERTETFDKATFINNNQVMTAYYDITSKLVGTTSHKTFDELPANAQKYIDKKYPGYDKQEVIFFDDNELNDTDMILYGNLFDDADNYFVDLKKDDKEIVLQVTMGGMVSFFKQLK
jgi:hypothetical protein